MVCIYCGSTTKVTNSRPEKRRGGVWRRRECLECGAIFTSREQADLSESLRVTNQADNKELRPFCRDQLFLDLYASCKHRPTALGDATALTRTVIDLLLPQAVDGLLTRKKILQTTHAVLSRFDTAAATLYAAYHPETSRR